jgi:maltose alpha-D-glucosyltransferase/alpha-amylase
MQWSADRNAGFSRANPQKLYLPINIDPEYHYESINVETQQNNPHSLLWWMKRIIALRKSYRAFGRGSVRFLYPENHKVLAFLRCFQEECILTVVNLSRFVQHVELDLSSHKDLVPVELIGRSEFPAIGEAPYFLTLGPHNAYWFSLEKPQPAEVSLPAAATPFPTIAWAESPEVLFRGNGRTALAEVLPEYFQRCRWFGGKARGIKGARVVETIPLPLDGATVYYTLVTINYIEGEPETYALLLAAALEKKARQVQQEQPQSVVAQIKSPGGEGVLYEAVWEPDLCQMLLKTIERRRHFRGADGELLAISTGAFRRLREPAGEALEAAIMKAEQTNTSIAYDDCFVLKILRRVEEGVNLDLEIGRFLTEKTSFGHTAKVAGFLEYRRNRKEPITLGILHGYVANQGDAWKYTLDALGNYYEDALAQRAGAVPELPPQQPLLDLTREEVPDLAKEMIGHYLESARLLGQRTGELHLALASSWGNPYFEPESFSTHYQRSIYQSMRNLTARVFQLLRARINYLPDNVRGEARRALDYEDEVFYMFHALLEHKMTAMRTRIHGDYHLGQVLYTGKDFVIIDFEGEPARSLTERRLKRSPVRDVAGMLRSFHYAAHHAIFARHSRPEDLPAMEQWAYFWQLWVSAGFLQSYLEAAGQGTFLPKEQHDLQVLLDAFCLEKAIYELGYELNNRPDWVKLPIQGILQLLQAPEVE